VLERLTSAQRRRISNVELGRVTRVKGKTSSFNIPPSYHKEQVNIGFETPKAGTPTPVSMTDGLAGNCISTAENESAILHEQIPLTKTFSLESSSDEEESSSVCTLDDETKVYSRPPPMQSLVLRSNRRVQTDSSSFDSDTSSHNYTSQSSYITQSSLSSSLGTTSIDECNDENNLNASFSQSTLKETQSSTVIHFSTDDVEIPVIPSVDNNNNNTFSHNWSWIDSYSTQITNDYASQESCDSTSSDEYHKMIMSPDISDSATDTPYRDSSQHPLGSTSSSTLLDKLCNDPRFREYCQTLDHKPTPDDFVAFKLVLLSENIEERFSQDIENAFQEISVYVLKNKLSYVNFVKISQRLALQAHYVQEQMLLVSCLGRRLYEKLPEFKSIINGYTVQAVEEMGLMAGLKSWSGDNPSCNPEIMWDYDDWSLFANDAYLRDQVILNENHAPSEVILTAKSQDAPVAEGHVHSNHSLNILPSLRRVSSVEVLLKDDDDDDVRISSPKKSQSLKFPRWKHRRSNSSVDSQSFFKTSAARSVVVSSSPATASSPGHVTDHVIEATSTEQVTAHLEHTKTLNRPSKPVILSLSSQTSVASVKSSITTVNFGHRQTSTSSVSSSTTARSLHKMDRQSSLVSRGGIDEEEEENDIVNHQNDTAKREDNRHGRRRSSLQAAISDAMTSPVLSPVITIVLPLAVLAVILKKS
jgi:hypothetical protein